MSLLDALNLRSDVSVCKLLGRLLNTFEREGFTSSFCPNFWNYYAFIVIASIHFVTVACEIIFKRFSPPVYSVLESMCYLCLSMSSRVVLCSCFLFYVAIR